MSLAGTGATEQERDGIVGVTDGRAIYHPLELSKSIQQFASFLEEVVDMTLIAPFVSGLVTDSPAFSDNYAVQRACLFLAALDLAMDTSNGKPAKRLTTPCIDADDASYNLRKATLEV